MSNEMISENEGKQGSLDELIEKGKNKGALSSGEIAAMIDEGESDLEQIGRLYEDLEFLSGEGGEHILDQNEFTEEIKNEIERYRGYGKNAGVRGSCH